MSEFKFETSFNLFPNEISFYRIDPASYNKESIVSVIKENYEKSPLRNKWDKTSAIHHYYNDWNNENFSKVDLSHLIRIYKDVFSDFTSKIFLTKNISFEFEINNITVMKEHFNFMATHHHIDTNLFFSAVHYISLPQEGAKIVFQNPMSHSNYIERTNREFIDTYFDNSKDSNSSLFKSWTLHPKENDMIIFPSYLEHTVPPLSVSLDKFRIAVVLNLLYKPEKLL